MPALPTIEPLLTRREAATRLHVSLRTLAALVASGDLPVVRISTRTIRIHPHEIDALVNRATERRGPPIQP